MGLLDFPNPVDWYESAANGKLEREAADALVSSALSGILSFLWTFGKNNWWGLGPSLRDLATSQYLTLSRLQALNGKWLTLTVPTEMLSADNLSRFQTSQVVK